jgi:feruloyl esterase
MNAGWEIPATFGMFGAPAGQKVSVPFCRVEGFSKPVPESRIGFEVWLPLAANWNEKFLAVGNPGFIGSIPHGALANIVQKRYATAATDTGHVGEDYDWAIAHPERLEDWGHRAVHETAVAAKKLIQSFYGKPVKYSYWNSCHNGGNQGLSEAQRYPKDFNGIVAGDPAYYVSRLQAGSLYIGWVSLKDGIKAPGYIPPNKYRALNKAALDACDANDGLADGIIEDPPRCKFEPQTILCKGEDNESCLTPPQVETAKKIYAGAKFADGKQLYSGFEPGSELGWAMMAAGPDPLSINAGYFKGIVFQDPNWDFRTFDVDRDTRIAESRTGAAVDNANPNLSAFKENGGKLILYQSWNETAVPPRMITEYYKSVQKAMGGPKETADFARLFMIAGSGMCPGFANAEDFNALEAVQLWVEEDIAPDIIVVTLRDDKGRAVRSRLVCSYPKVSRYKGTGDPNEAANFECITPDK